MNEGQISGIGVKTVNDRCVGDSNRVIKPGSPPLTVLASTPIDCRITHGLVRPGLPTHIAVVTRQCLASSGRDTVATNLTLIVTMPMWTAVSIALDLVVDHLF